MLTGKIIYKSGGMNYKYNVLGADTSTSLSLRLESSNYNAMAELAKVDGVEPEDSNVLWSRRMDVHLANIVVETVVHKVDGKKVKEPLNSDFL